MRAKRVNRSRRRFRVSAPSTDGSWAMFVFAFAFALVAPASIPKSSATRRAEGGETATETSSSVGTSVMTDNSGLGRRHDDDE